MGSNLGLAMVASGFTAVGVYSSLENLYGLQRFVSSLKSIEWKRKYLWRREVAAFQILTIENQPIFHSYSAARAFITMSAFMNGEHLP